MRCVFLYPTLTPPCIFVIVKLFLNILFVFCSLQFYLSDTSSWFYKKLKINMHIVCNIGIIIFLLFKGVYFHHLEEILGLYITETIMQQ